LPIDHILIFAMRYCTMINNTISYDNASQIYLSPFTNVVVGINEDCQIRNVFACIRFPCYEEFPAFVFRIFLEEIDKCVETVI